MARNFRTSELRARSSMGNDRQNSLRANTPPERFNRGLQLHRGDRYFSSDLASDRTIDAFWASVLLPVAQRIFPHSERELQSLALRVWTARLQAFFALVLT